LRILQVTPYFPPAWGYGGPPRVMWAYAAGLAARGHEVTVYTTDVLDGEQRARSRNETMGGVEVRRFPNLSNGLAWRRKKYLPRRLFRTLLAEIGSYDAVHATDTRTFLTASTYLASRRRGVPFCLSAHGSLPGSSGLRGLVKRAYDTALVRPMLERAALLLAQTDHEAELYRAGGGRPTAIRRLPLPLELEEVVAGADGRLRRLAGLPDGSRILLFLGRIHRLKGLDVLCEALEPLLQRDPSLVLVVVGRDDGQWGDIQARFRHLLDGGSVRFVGPLYGDERFSAYAEADVFCLTPRHWEETSLAALEAAACGTPIVVTEQAEIPGLDAADGGRIVPLDPAAIRSAVAEVLARKDEMGAAARELVRRQHERDAVVELLEDYLREAVGQP
jgi:glycosyltransferase involved in cell wall biosynthesis